MTPKNQTTIADLTRIAFSEDGPLSRRIEGYAPNPTQAAYAQTVASMFDEGTPEKPVIGCLEAATGIGKTLGYAIPLMLYCAITGNRAAISTYTIHLQSQMVGIGGDLETAKDVVAELTGHHLVAALRVGLNNFVSPSRARQALAEKGILSVNATGLTKTFLSWAATSQTGLIMEWTDRHGEIPEGLSKSEICCQPYSPEEEKSRWMAHRERAKSADLVITNHALAILHASSKNFSVLDEEGARPISVIVADEAENLEKAATVVTNRAACLNTMGHLFAKTTDFTCQALGGGIRELRTLAEVLDTGGTHITLRDKPDAIHKVSQKLECLLPLFDRAIAKTGDMELKTQMLLHKAALECFGENIRQQAYGAEAVISYSDIKRFPSLRLINPNPGTAFGRLWEGKDGAPSYLQACLLTSATLSDGQEHSLRTVANGLGLYRSANNAFITGIYEPLNFGHLSIVLPDEAAPIPTLPVGAGEFSSDPKWVLISKMLQPSEAKPLGAAQRRWRPRADAWEVCRAETGG